MIRHSGKEKGVRIADGNTRGGGKKGEEGQALPSLF